MAHYFQDLFVEEEDATTCLTFPLHFTRILRHFPSIRMTIFHPDRLLPMSNVQGAEYHVPDIYQASEPTHFYFVFDRKPLEQLGHWIGIRDLAPYLRQDSILNPLVSGKQACHMCFKSISCGARSNVSNHKCTVRKCTRCHSQFETQAQLQEHCRAGGGGVLCLKCNLKFFNNVCRGVHDLHCTGNNHRCPDCLQVYSGPVSQHVCLSYLCNFCQVQVPHNHVCYMVLKHDATHHDAEGNALPIDEEYLQEQLGKIYAFDFESQFVPGAPIRVAVRDGQGRRTGDEREWVPVDEHQVNYIVIKRLGMDDEEWYMEKLEDMVEWMVAHEDGGTLIAHNMKGYDGRLLFNHLVESGQAPESCVWIGTKIMSMKWNNWNIRDTLTHCAFPLAQMTSVFGLDPEQYAKGYFPYKFNRPENRNYVGPLPGIEYFEPSMMTPKKRAEFIQWHTEESARRTALNEPYIFWEELKKYCISDVKLLAKAMEVYAREGMVNNQGLNPLKCCTIASYALKVYRNLHMPEETLVHLSAEEEKFARRALHGGRTDVRQLLKHYSEEDVERGVYGCYQDVQSLYPTVQFYDPMPVGQPEKLTFAHRQPTMEEVRSWFGFVECDLEVTEAQFHPVIVGKSEDTKKLVADLNDKKKIVITTPELKTALDNGYRLTKVHAAHLYKPSTDLFKSYLQTFLKLKIEASGMPKHIKTEEDWQRFAEHHAHELGVVLERGNMVKNPGRKQLAKLMLNSLWGKFAERKHWTNYVKFDRNHQLELHAFENRYDRGELDILYRSYQPASGQAVLIYREDPDMVDVRNQDSYVNLSANVSVAAFVTAFGALRLWTEMNKLGQRVLYHDTDSIIYERDPHGYNIPLGQYLGEWECETGGLPIVDFVSTGPKTYAYKVREEAIPYDEEDVSELEKHGVEWAFKRGSNRDMIYSFKPVCKAKGFTLNSFNAARINFSTMRDLVLENVQSITAKSLKFQYRRGFSMFTREEWKEMTFQYNKGIVDDEFRVWPFGIERFANYEGPRRGLVMTQ